MTRAKRIKLKGIAGTAGRRFAMPALFHRLSSVVAGQPTAWRIRPPIKNAGPRGRWDKLPSKIAANIDLNANNKPVQTMLRMGGGVRVARPDVIQPPVTPADTGYPPGKTATLADKIERLKVTPMFRSAGEFTARFRRSRPGGVDWQETCTQEDYANDPISEYVGLLSRAIAEADTYVIGSGVFSTVFGFQGRDDFVVKKSRMGDGGQRYLMWAYERRGRFAGLPNVYAYQRVGAYMYFLLDKLDAPNWGNSKNDMAVKCGLLLTEEYMSDSYDLDAVYELDDYHVAVVELVIRLKKECENESGPIGECSPDLHRGNVMIDREGRLVITDPLC